MFRPQKDIPDRWQNYTAVGKRLKGTRFIAFKVPLKQALTRTLPPSEVFGPWELLDAVGKDNQELGLIIDLTFTKRYYTLQDVPQSLLYVKVYTAGHEIPSDDTILSFKRAVHAFLQNNKDNDKLIGVHCTHGLNRTGYLICRYLIDVDGMDPAQAVELFNSSRGYAIERQNYLLDLQNGPQRSNVGIEESEQEPQRGQAICRPTFSASNSRTHSQVGFSDPWNQRPYHPRRGMNRFRLHPTRSHHIHRPPLLPYPPLGFPPSAFGHPSRWSPPVPDALWSRPPDSNSSSRISPPSGVCPPLLPRYSPY